MLPKLNGKELSRNISDYLLENGAISVGFSTRETLADSPPSADITYLMENGLSAVTFAVPLNKEGIRPYLAKEDRFILDLPVTRTGLTSQEISDGLAEMIGGDGHQAISTSGNLKYRTEVENWQSFMPPDISHRYLAVASGAGSFGWSGNVGVKGYGTAILLATVLTDAQLEPTLPIPPEESFCSDCRACAGACPMEMFSATEEMSFTLGGREYAYAARIDLLRCMICCGGATGMHKSRKWSSWSPGRFEVPEDRNDLLPMVSRMIDSSQNRPPMGGEFTVPYGESSKSENEDVFEITFTRTCTVCALVCTGDKKENLENLRMLRGSGCAIQYPDGSLEVLPGDEAEVEFNRMPAEHKALYC